MRLLSLLTVGESMRREIAVSQVSPLRASMSLRDALSAFVSSGSESLPVVDDEDRPCGTLWFRDLLNQEAAHDVVT